MILLKHLLNGFYNNHKNYIYSVKFKLNKNVNFDQDTKRHLQNSKRTTFV